MITVNRKLITEGEVLEKLVALGRRYHIQSHSYEKSDADLMSDFDAQKWLSLCDQLEVARSRRSERSAGGAVPLSLRSIYVGNDAPFRSEDLEDTSDKLIALAA